MNRDTNDVQRGPCPVYASHSHVVLIRVDVLVSSPNLETVLGMLLVGPLANFGC